MSATIRFGRSDLAVSPVCFGTWQLSPRFWGEIPKDDALAAMRAAREAGVNFFDTADAYGDGHGESVLGAFLATVPRDEVVVATKVFNHFNPDGSRYPDLSPDHVRRRCDIELQRLGTDVIDLYLLHFYDQLTPLPAIAGVLDELKAAGKIRHYGVSNFNAEQLRAARAFGDFDAIQPAYSLIATDSERELLPCCQAADVGVMVYSPLHKGLLTGKYTGDETFTDFRKHHPDFRGDRFRRIAAAVRSLGDIAAGYGMSIYQLVLAATLMHPAIHVAVVGIKTPAQIREAAAVMGRTVSREDYFRIRKLLAIDAPAKLKDADGVSK